MVCASKKEIFGSEKGIRRVPVGTIHNQHLCSITSEIQLDFERVEIIGLVRRISNFIIDVSSKSSISATLLSYIDIKIFVLIITCIWTNKYYYRPG